MLAVREVAREMGGIDAPRTDGEVIDVIDVTEVGRETAGLVELLLAIAQKLFHYLIESFFY